MVTTWDHRGRPATSTDDTSCTATAAPRVTYRYDAATMPEAPAARFPVQNAQGQLTGVIDAAGGQQYSYDALGRVVAERRWWNDGFYAPITYTYDPEGNLEELNLDRRVAVRSGFGTGGRLETLEVAIGGAAVDILTDVTYHPDGTWAELAYGNGVTLTREVDGLLRTSNISVGGSTDDVFYALTYDDNVVTMEDIDGTDTLEYDGADRLTRVFYGDDGTEQTFTYDDSGNITDLGGDYATFSGYTYTYNREDAHGYDAVGNLVDDGVSSFVYDARAG